jgi:site-specific DNA-methyltransferase (adenine-specific)
MEYLVKLVAPEGALVLDPFGGSGTTAVACLRTNRRFILMERDAESVAIANRRIENEGV